MKKLLIMLLVCSLLSTVASGVTDVILPVETYPGNVTLSASANSWIDWTVYWNSGAPPGAFVPISTPLPVGTLASDQGSVVRDQDFEFECHTVPVRGRGRL